MGPCRVGTVSYTHLDVYKRQGAHQRAAREGGQRPEPGLAGRSGPVSYTHLDVYKRQARYLARPAGVAFPFGLYHLAATGDASWHEYACFIAQQARRAGLAVTLTPGDIRAVSSDQYPVSYTHLDVYKRQNIGSVSLK